MKEDYNPQEYLEQLGNQQIVQGLLKLLESKPRSQQVIILRYGLNDGIQRSLQEIGDRFGLTRERIRQIEDKSLKIFRKNRVQFLGKIKPPDIAPKRYVYVKAKPSLAEPLTILSITDNITSMIDQETPELFTEIENLTENIEFLPNQEPLEELANNDDDDELLDQESYLDIRSYHEDNYIQLSLFSEDKPNLNNLIQDMQKLSYSEKLILLRAIADELAKEKIY